MIFSEGGSKEPSFSLPHSFQARPLSFAFDSQLPKMSPDENRYNVLQFLCHRFGSRPPVTTLAMLPLLQK